jgi:hypothetical protein
VTSDGQVHVLSSSLVKPAGLACDVQGNVYVADAGATTVTVVASGGEVSTLPGTFHSVTAVAVDAQGNCYVADYVPPTISAAERLNRPNSTVSQITPQGQVHVIAPGLYTPKGLAVDGQGNVYIADQSDSILPTQPPPDFQGSVLRLTPGGQSSLLASGFSRPVSLVPDNQGDLLLVNTGDQSVQRITLGSVAVRTSVATLPISLGNASGGSGVNLTNAALARIQAPGSITFGDTNQQGTITVAGVTPGTLTSAVIQAIQASSGKGSKIVLDDQGGTAVALSAGRSQVALSAGTGGIVAASVSNATAEIATAGAVVFSTPGPIGSATSRIQFDPAGPPLVAVDTSAQTPRGVYLDGLGSLSLGSISAVTGTSIDVTARGNLTVAPGATVTATGALLSLAADVKLDGTGDDGNGTLAVSAGATVPGSAISLRGADMTLATGTRPAVVSATGFPGSISIRSSLPARPISLGAADNAVAGINLTAAELADLSATIFFIGDAGQAGDITLANVNLTAVNLFVQQSSTSPGKIILDDNFATALDVPNATVSLTSGAGGIHEIHTGAEATAVIAFILQLSTPAPVGSLAHPLSTQVSGLLASNVGGSLFLTDTRSLTTTGNIAAAGLLDLTLGGDFLTHPGDLTATAIDLSFTGVADQSFDSGGQTIDYLTHPGLGTLTLLSGLTLTGNLTNTGGDLDTNNQAVSVGGLATIGAGTYTAGSAAQTFTGGLIVNGGFSGGSGVITTGGVNIGIQGFLIAPSSTLTDNGDWTDAGGVFYANGGTVILAGTAPHSVIAPGEMLDNLTHTGPGTVTLGSNLALSGTFSSGPDAGGLDITNRTVQIGGDWRWNANGTLSVAGSTIVFSGSGTQTLVNIRQALNNLTHTGTGSLFVGTDLTLNGSFTNAAGAGNLDITTRTVQLGGSWTWQPGGTLLASSSTLVFAGGSFQALTSGGQTLGSLSHTGTGNLLISDDLSLSGSLTSAASSGILDITGRTVRLAGDWSFGSNPNPLRSSGSTVILDGTNQHVNGSSSFNNLTKVVTTSDTLTFQAGTTQAVAGTLTLQGSAGSPLFLRSSLTGQTWSIGAASSVIAYVDVQDSTNANTAPLQATTSHDSGNNHGWTFVDPVQTWTGATGPDGSDAGNWSLGFAPNAGDSIVIPGSAALQPVLDGPLTVKSLTIQPGATLTLAGNALTVTGSFINQGTLVLQGNEAISLAGGNDTREGTWRYVGDGNGQVIPLKDFGATDYFNLIVADTHTHPDTFQTGPALSLGGSLTITGGTFTAVRNAAVRTAGVTLTGGALFAPALLTDLGDWTNQGGTFTANHGTVTLSGTGQHINGSTTFFNLSKTARSTDTLTFQAGATQTIAGTLTLKGCAGHLLRLRSSTPGSVWGLDPLSAALVSFVDVQDSVVLGKTPLRAGRSHNSGNNMEWKFA